MAAGLLDLPRALPAGAAAAVDGRKECRRENRRGEVNDDEWREEGREVLQSTAKITRTEGMRQRMSNREE